MKHGFMEDYRC
jgi:hypothetical protein